MDSIPMLRAPCANKPQISQCHCSLDSLAWLLTSRFPAGLGCWIGRAEYRLPGVLCTVPSPVAQPTPLHACAEKHQPPKRHANQGTQLTAPTTGSQILTMAWWAAPRGFQKPPCVLRRVLQGTLSWFYTGATKWSSSGYKVCTRISAQLALSQ